MCVAVVTPHERKAAISPLQLHPAVRNKPLDATSTEALPQRKMPGKEDVSFEQIRSVSDNYNC